MNKEELIKQFIEKHKEDFENFCKEQKNGKFIPKAGEMYYFVDTHGFVFSSEAYFDYGEDFDNFVFAKNTTYFFRTKEEAEKYRDFLNDIYDLRKEFVDGEMNYQFYYNYRSKKLLIDYYHYSKYQNFHFTKENANKLLEKYGEEYIKNYLLDVWE